MRILVVGGAGYIGSVTCEHLVAQGYEVIVFDNLSKGHLASVPDGAKFVHGDFGNESNLENAFSLKPDAVMHFGALSIVGESVSDPAQYFKNNVGKGLTLLDYSLKKGVNRFVFSSTAAVYGQPDQYPISEDFPLLPVNPYGESKLAFERILSSYSRAYGLRYVALRYFNAAGATAYCGEDHSPETHLIPIVLRAAEGSLDSVTIFGDDYPTKDGTCIRDYIHVSDLAEAHILAMNALGEHHEQVYNLGSENGFSVKEVIRAAEEVTGRPIPTKIGERRDGDPPVLIASSAKIRSALGWKPAREDLKSIIEDAWIWKKLHPKGYTKEESSRV